MTLVHCPLCCQQEFDSVLALREHLLYYTYRPVMCFFCNVPFNGIANMIQHLEVHLVRSEMKLMSGHGSGLKLYEVQEATQSDDSTGKTSDLVTESLQPETNSSVIYPQSVSSVDGESVISAASNHPPRLETPSTKDDGLNRELIIRAYTCVKCGAKVVGKDSYFIHLQNGCTPTENISPDPEPDLGEDSEVSNDTTATSCFSPMEETPEISQQDSTKSQPYIHKKFDHDLERNTSSEGKAQCYMNTFQSFLVDRLNQTSLVDDDSDGTVSEDHVESLPAEIPKKPYPCRYCPKSFSKSFLVVRHQVECHTSRRFDCTVCGNKFKSSRSLKNHMDSHGTERMKCEVCSYVCKTSSGLRTHMFEVHSETRTEFLCSDCGRVFRKKYGLQRHIQRLHKPLDLQCEFCPKKFSSKEDYHSHAVSHTEPASCDICHKKFSNHWGLLRHRKSAHTDVSFGCDQCGKVFKRKDILKKHLHMHDRKSEHACKICQKTFITNLKLVQHSKTHEPP